MTEEELNEIEWQHDSAVRTYDWTASKSIVKALIAEVRRLRGERDESRKVLGWACDSLMRTYGYTAVKRTWRKVFGEYVAALTAYSKGRATASDIAVLGLPEPPKE